MSTIYPEEVVDVANVFLDEIKLYNQALSKDQVQLDMTSGVPTTSCTTLTTTTTATSTTTSTSFTSTSTATTTSNSATLSGCVGHYWPIGNRAVTDLITGRNGTSQTPQFVADRNGVANGAIWVNGSVETTWQLPADTYFQGDTTMTMWVKKIACISGSFGNHFKN
jgi:hypothetical protein